SDFMASGQAKRLTAENRLSTNAAWTGDGDRILYRVTSGIPARSELRLIAASGSGSPEPAPFQDDNLSEFSLGRRFVYSQYTRDVNIWHTEIARAGGPPGLPRRLIDSTHGDYDALPAKTHRQVREDRARGRAVRNVESASRQWM